MRNKCYRRTKVMTDFSLVDMSSQAVCSKLASRLLAAEFLTLTRHKVVSEKVDVVLWGRLRASSTVTRSPEDLSRVSKGSCIDVLSSQRTVGMPPKCSKMGAKANCDPVE